MSANSLTHESHLVLTEAYDSPFIFKRSAEDANEALKALAFNIIVMKPRLEQCSQNLLGYISSDLNRERKPRHSIAMLLSDKRRSTKGMPSSSRDTCGERRDQSRVLPETPPENVELTTVVARTK